MDRALVYLDGAGVIDCNTLAADLMDAAELHAFDVRAEDGHVQIRLLASVPERHWSALLKTARVEVPDTVEELA